MPFPARRALRVGALTLTAIFGAGLLYTMLVYRSVNVFTPPESIESLGRTYLLGNAEFSREELDQRYGPTHTGTWTLERAGFLPSVHGIYQWQNDEVRGEATTSAFLKWGDRYIAYSLSGGP
ncbi:hypothetical protein FCG67_01825 [Rhodococcus oryzae]|uniref:Uncharacterized protein n=1 Tax=Rhodococcus oryzae TaxID=2571143 RepID=A0ABY2RQZ6_9NOCA|nr:hypothetical protein [Rhodococcus oryzae]TJZ81397.1 hypothetical protein FCG67_01825 [Rhodococcus oryzae]